MSAGREVFLGFAPANLLYSLSFADVLDEDTGRGYQRRFNPAHSLDFRKYIQQDKSSTIPLTFNARERTELFIALHLNNETESPWYRQLNLGGHTTSGMTRRASLRTMQKAIKKFLTQTKILQRQRPDAVAQMVLDFWSAIALLLRDAW